MSRLPHPIKQVYLEDIKPYWRNPRKNGPSVPLVKQSIMENGYVNMISVDKDMVIVTGHTRYKAILSMSNDERLEIGIQNTFPVVVLESLSPEQCKRFRIQDNKAGEQSVWNFDLLIPELRECSNEGMSIFFPGVDLNEMLKPPNFTTAMETATDAEVDEADEDIREKFSNAVEKDEAEKMEVMCPSCTHVFFIQGSTFSR